MRSVLFGLSVMFVAACISIGMTQADEATDKQQAEKQPSIHDLLEERCETLEQVVEMRVALVARGTVPPESVIGSQIDLLNARLELADTQARRIELMKQRVDCYKKLEEVQQAHLMNATGTRIEVMDAKAERLEAEIELLREEKKE
ncbi:hypothetical protein GC197_16445 [bacterium]|nr:hypothetical protein [bacterium]